MTHNAFRQHDSYDIDPDEIFLDSSNLPEFDRDQFEGKIEQPISFSSIRIIGLFMLLVLALFTAKLFSIQVVNGETYHTQSEQNRLRHSLIFAERGVITDRNGEELAWNNISGDNEIPERQYTESSGFGHLLGYTKPPAKDDSGEFYRLHTQGMSGAESRFNDLLQGTGGTTIIETDAHREVVSKNLIEDPIPGERVELTIDAEVNRQLHQNIQQAVETYNYEGGASVIMDVDSGELLALTSYPETDPNVLSGGRNEEEIDRYANDPNNPYLNRAYGGVFTPGSITKPFIAAGILEEDIIHPTDNILSDGALEIQNPYNEDETFVFRDWQAHGLVDMREALAHSSDQYFYVTGGGYKEVDGLGIDGINRYMNMFGFGKTTGARLGGSERSGVVPNPEWKEETFGEGWYLGNTYHTSIGQYGFLVTPLQTVRATAAIANDGILHTPRISSRTTSSQKNLDLNSENLRVIREGMQLAVEEGTARSLNVDGVSIAAKTGTAEVGTEKGYENSWVIGFFPAENPRFAFATVLEHAPEKVSFGAAPSMRSFFEWLRDEKPEYADGSFDAN